MSVYTTKLLECAIEIFVNEAVGYTRTTKDKLRIDGLTIPVG
jgi:hypothetical protein